MQTECRALSKRRTFAFFSLYYGYFTFGTQCIRAGGSFRYAI